MNALEYIVLSSSQNGSFDDFLCMHEIEMLNTVLKMEGKNIITKKCNFTILMTCFANNGYLGWLKYLYKQSSAESEQSSARSEQSSAGSKNGCLWDKSTCENAARGHLDCLKYLHENGCPWDEWLCLAAALYYPKCLKYLHDNGCSSDTNLLMKALSHYPGYDM
ncbi:MAG: hypothetical protein KAS12_04200 [Candidatus Aenigmarchaeota archaeon]|nr:hypothetical protein [Candidatus Aenigmarchaeota archaeon]